MQIERSIARLFSHPELAELVDGLDGELGEQVVEQAERAEGVLDAVERVGTQLLNNVALQVEGGQRVQAGQGAGLQAPGGVGAYRVSQM